MPRPDATSPDASAGLSIACAQAATRLAVAREEWLGAAVHHLQGDPIVLLPRFLILLHCKRLGSASNIFQFQAPLPLHLAGPVYNQ